MPPPRSPPIFSKEINISPRERSFPQESEVFKITNCHYLKSLNFSLEFHFLTTKSQLNKMAAKLLTEAEISKSALAQLPVANSLSSLNLFFSQVGNYAFSLTENLSESGLDSQDIANIEKLSEISKRVEEILNKSHGNYNNLEYWATTLDNEISQTVEENGLSISLTELEDEFKDYPTLIYDGPYSDHILNKESALLKDEVEITKDQAFEKAVKFSNIKDLEFESK